MDLSVEGKAYITGSFEQCCIGVENGKISSIKKVLKGDEHLDFSKRLILPAGIDIHVHFRDPGMTNKENFATGSMGAAFGGVSCFFDMPNTIPQTTDMNNLSDKIMTASKKSFVDFGVYAGITDSNINNIKTISKKCNGFKIYLGSTTNSLRFNIQNLKEALTKISMTNKPVLFHAENDVCLNKCKMVEKNLTDHLNSRPAICEETAIKNILEASKGINSKVHICHLSSCEGLNLLRSRSKNISCGVTPHHCLLSAEKKLSPQTHFKVNPPLRTTFDKETLFNTLRNGFIDVLESDHAPHTLDEKDAEFNDAPSGIPGVETMYPMFLYLAKQGKLSFQSLISLLCEKPAEILNVPKGKIKVGNDADFIVVDLKKECKIDSEKLHSKCGWSPFNGWPALFPDAVFIRGEKIIENDEIQVSQGFGKFVGE